MSQDDNSLISNRPTMAAGWRFGRLTAVEFSERDAYRKQRWLFRCDCGAALVINVSDVKAGRTVSCGCFNKDRIATIGRSKRTHGMTETVEYRTWTNMIVRCTSPRDLYYHCYGGRGIRVCDEWLNSFEAFYRDMGKKPSAHHSIDRINNDGNYEPSNCRWATKSQQASNQRRGKRNA